MPDHTSSSILIQAEPDAVMDVIADFAAYPEWVHGMKQVQVLAEDSQGRAEQVYFELDASPIKDQYTLAYEWPGRHVMRWHLVEGKMLKAMDGAYELVEESGGTEVTYRLAVDISIPMIGMLKRRAEKVVIDNALKGLKQRVEGHG